MKHQGSGDFEFFYQELPQSDYLDDIEIDDDVEDPVGESTQGLSEEQVSEIARDSLGQPYSEEDIQQHDRDSNDTRRENE